MKAAHVSGLAISPVRDALQSQRLAAPSTPVARVGEPGELVAPALVILADEAEAWQIPSNGARRVR